MTQLGEAVGVAQFLDNDDPCPFSHDPPPEETVKNRLIGKGGWLRSAMEGEDPTFYYPNAPGFFKDPKLQNPKAEKAHPFHQDRQPVANMEIDGPGGTRIVLKFPVTCAAHHLIPAQESLKESDLTEYMIKKGESGTSAKVATGRSTSAKSGKCWSNVGYEVNGSQNGVWLPGSYAVHGTAWIPLTDGEDVSEDGTTAANSDKLTGLVVCDEALSRKWIYVKQAVEKASSFSSRGYGGQFHDRHEPYSDFVVKILQKIHERMQNKERVNIDGQKCENCKKRSKDINERGIPTPFGLVQRLNIVSQGLEARLKGTIWHPGLYTSEWGNAYIQKLMASRS